MCVWKKLKIASYSWNFSVKKKVLLTKFIVSFEDKSITSYCNVSSFQAYAFIYSTISLSMDPKLIPINTSSTSTIYSHSKKTTRAFIIFLEMWPIIPNSLGPWKPPPPLTLQVLVTTTDISLVSPLSSYFHYAWQVGATHDSISSNPTYEISHLSSMLLGSRFWPLQP